MPGTLKGGQKAAATTRRKHGANFFVKIGALGGKARHPNKGFGGMPKDFIIAMGKKGGSMSKPYSVHPERLAHLRNSRNETNTKIATKWATTDGHN